MSLSNETTLGLGKYSWSQVIKWLMGALVIYALCSVFIANPFSIFVDRHTPVDYSRIMYFHGLTVSLAGIVCLTLTQIYHLDSVYKKIIFYCTVMTIFFGITGGAINRSMEESKIYLWYQTISFIALDIILIALFVGLLRVKNAELRGTASYYLVVTSSGTMIVAALIGDLMGVLLDFGDLWGMYSWYATKIGYTVSQWNDQLLRAHSDMIVIAVMGLILSMVSWKYGRHLSGTANNLKVTGEWVSTIGLLLMSVILVVAGFCGVNWQIPHIFTEKGFYAPRGQSVAGIDLADFVIGTLFFFGGLAIIIAALFGKRINNMKLSNTAKYTLSGILLTWLCIIITVAGIGFLQEYQANLYSSSNDVPLAEYGFAFRMLHLNVSLILFPAIMMVMLFVQHFLKDNQNKLIQLILRVAVVLCTIGSLTYMTLNPTVFGPGYLIVSIGFAFVVMGMIYFFVKANNTEIERFNTK